MIALGNLASWWLQLALFVATAALVPAALRIRHPRVLLNYWQGVLSIGLLLGPLSLLLAPHRGSAPFLLRDQVSSVARASDLIASSHWFAWLLIAVSAVLLARLMFGFAALRRYRLQSVPFPLNAEQTGLVDRIAPGTRVLVNETSSGGPVSYGWRKPVILLPRACSRMQPHLLQAVLTHELVHIRRRDWVLHVGEELVRAVLWFHPAVWYAVARIRLLREETVDLEAIAMTEGATHYVNALLEVAQAAGGSLSAAAPFSLEHQLVARVRLITRQLNKENPMTLRKARLTLATLFALLAITGGAAIVAAPLQSAGEKTYGAADGVEVPKVIFKKSPMYPASAKNARTQGIVKLALTISKDGQPYNIHVTEGVDSALDQAAIDAVQQWRWEPGMKDGAPVLVSTEIQITFTLVD